MISIKNLTKIYNSKNVVYRNFSYNITNNLFLLIGPNGSGKTTLLNCITSYIRYKGKIDLKGVISYLPEIRDFDDDVIAIDLINLFNKFYKTDVSSYLNRLDFEKYKKTKINDLSKGNKTKLFLLCTLTKPSNIYIFDEPTDGLDIKGKDIFVDICRELSKSKRVIISTHDMGVVNQLKNESQILDLGKVEKC